jgi:amino acid transporter
MFVILGGCQGNALAFGSAIQMAASPVDLKVNHTLQKIFAIAIVGLACLIQAYSRSSNFFISNVIGLFKVLFLAFITVTGLVALAGVRSAKAAEAYPGPFGKENLVDAFSGTRTSYYNWGIAMLLTQRAFLGFEYANQVSSQVTTGFLTITGSRRD